MVRFAKPHISVIYTEQWRNMMVLNNQDFIIENLTVRFTIYVFSVIFKNSAAVTNMLPGFTKPTFIPAHPFEIFGADFEDIPGKILLWGNINISSPIKYLSFYVI